MAITKDRKDKAKAAERAQELRPYIERALRDEELQEHIRSAYESARRVYDRLSGGKGVDDKKVRKELRHTVEELRVAGDRLRAERKRKGGGWFRRLFFLGLVGALFANPVTGPRLRAWVQDQVFGSGEEFSYGGSDQ